MIKDEQLLTKYAKLLSSSNEIKTFYLNTDWAETIKFVYK